MYDHLMYIEKYSIYNLYDMVYCINSGRIICIFNSKIGSKIKISFSKVMFTGYFPFSYQKAISSLMFLYILLSLNTFNVNLLTPFKNLTS